MKIEALVKSLLDSDSARFAVIGGILDGMLPKWTHEPPTVQGWYWHWNGDYDCGPVPTSVLWSGTTGKCFVTMGQLGLTHPIDCDEYGGWWMPLQEPMLPR